MRGTQAYLLDAGAAGSTQSLGADESPSHQDSDQGSWFPFFHKRHDTESPRGHRPPRHTHGASGSGRPASLSNLKASDGAAGGRDGFASLVRAAPKLQRGGTGPMLPSAPSKLISRLASCASCAGLSLLTLGTRMRPASLMQPACIAPDPARVRSNAAHLTVRVSAQEG